MNQTEIEESWEPSWEENTYGEEEWGENDQTDYQTHFVIEEENLGFTTDIQIQKARSHEAYLGKQERNECTGTA